MTTKFCKPKSPILQNYIEGYYFLSHSENEGPITYYTFPNNFTFLSIVQNTQFAYAENSVNIQEKPGYPILCNLICHYKKPIRLTYSGNISEITIAFKPLGLNAFLTQPLRTYTNAFFSDFISFSDIGSIFIDILPETNFEKKCELLEAFWLSKLIGFQHPYLHQIVDDLKNTHQDLSITKLALKYNTSRQNLTKQFEMHLCKSPSMFKKLQRFRTALKLNLEKTPKENLATMGYDLLFYDQSHLTKDFKSLTGLTPKNFFKKVSQLEKGTINWVFT